MSRRPYRYAEVRSANPPELPRVYFRATREQRAKTAYLDTVRVFTPAEHERAREWMRECDAAGVDPFRVIARCPSSRLVHVPGVVCSVCDPKGRARAIAAIDDGEDL